MPGQPTSDAAFDLHRVCLHGIQFTYGIDLYLPGYGRKPPEKEPPPRFQRIQVSRPPPARASNGGAWFDCIYVGPKDDQTLKAALDTGAWKQQDLFYLPDLFSLYQEGIASLGEPPANAIILDKLLTIPFVHALAAPDGPAPAARPEMFMAIGPPSSKDRLGFLAVPYPQPPPGQVEVNFKATLTCKWKASPVPLEEDEEKNWIAISFDQFTPPERSSADYLARIQDCTVETATTCVEPTVTVNARDPSG
jgi:hypothetical protein